MPISREFKIKQLYAGGRIYEVMRSGIIVDERAEDALPMDRAFHVMNGAVKPSIDVNIKTRHTGTQIAQILSTVDAGVARRRCCLKVGLKTIKLRLVPVRYPLDLTQGLSHPHERIYSRLAIYAVQYILDILPHTQVFQHNQPNLAIAGI